MYVLAANFESRVEPNVTDAGLMNILLNFTVNNTETISGINITQVNITLPSGFTFISGYNGTAGNSTPTDFSFSSPNATWANTTPVGFIKNDTKAYFWFNVTVSKTASGNYNFTISTLDTNDVLTSKIVSVFVEKTVWSYPKEEFYAKPVWIKLNWTNNNQENVTITVNSSLGYAVDIRVVNDTTNIVGNYSQKTLYDSVEEKKKYGATGSRCFNYEQAAYDNPLLIMNSTGFENVQYSAQPGTPFNFTFIQSVVCPPGKYYGTVMLHNRTSTIENLNITITIDVPISTDNELNSTYGNGTFKGRINANATLYHHYFFNTSSIKNATSVTFKLTNLNKDLDLFLFNSSNLMARSIKNSTISEELTYNYLPKNEMWEIRIYGNFTSGYDDYTGSIHFSTLNMTNAADNSLVSKINLGTVYPSNKSIINLTLRNEGSLNLSNVRESKKLYHIATVGYDSAPRNFSFLVPSFATKVRASINWTGASSYALSLYKPDGTLIGISNGKRNAANITNAMQEEFVEATSITQGLWRVMITNTTIANSDPYNVTFKFWVNPSNWIQSNYTTQTFNKTNKTQTFHLNFTIQNNTFHGKYEGWVSYTSDSGATLKIPIEFNVSTPELVVNNNLQSSSVTIKDNIGFNRTDTKVRQIIVKINNTGNMDLTIDGNVSSPYLNHSSNYMEYTFDYPKTAIAPGSYGNLTINISIDTTKTNNVIGIYKGWIYLNSSSSHPYSYFNLTVQVNLTNALSVNVLSVESIDGDNEIENVTKAENITIKARVYFINNTEALDIFKSSDFAIWLTEGNVSMYRVPASGSFTVYNDSDPGDDVWIEVDRLYDPNVTIPANLPGGKYYVRLGVSRYFNGANLIGNGSYYSLIVNNTGLFMSTNASSCNFGTSLCNPSLTLINGSTQRFVVNISNFGPVAASSATIQFSENCDGYSVDIGGHSGCGASASSDNTNKKFTIYPSAYSSSCLVWWTIKAGSSAASACTGNIIGSGAKWFYSYGVNVTVTVTTPTTTTTTTTTTIGDTGNITTTTTIPAGEVPLYLNITSYPALVKIQQGKSKNETVTVKNTNNTISQNVTLTIENIDSNWYTITPSGSVSLNAGESKNYTISFTIPTEAEIKDYASKFKATSEKASVSKEFTLRVEPSEAKKAEIKDTILRLESNITALENELNGLKQEGYDVTGAELLLNQTKQKLKNAKDYIARGDYFSAYQLIDDIESLIKETRTKLREIEKPPGISIWRIIVVSVVLGVAGFLIYLFWPVEEKPKIRKPEFLRKPGYNHKRGRFIYKPKEESHWEKLKLKWIKEKWKKIKKIE